MIRGLNMFMHPRNPYKTAPNFAKLSEEFPEFKKITNQESNGKVTVDFKNPEALRILTQTLLKKDFGLEVIIPSDRLIPTLALRLNYILWIEDLLTFAKLSSNDVVGVDIGTGASCIYPLLGCKLNGWRFVATETDKKSIECCKKNIDSNSMGKCISLLCAEKESSPLDVIIEKRRKDEKYSFCMCNPPFFSSIDEAIASHKTTKTSPSATNTASANEMITDGGEIKFVCEIIDDSLKLKENITLYTTMLGKKSSLKIIKKYLSKENITNFATTQFCQGKTMRWGIAWSFCQNINLEELSKNKVTSKPLELIIPQSVLRTIEEAALKIHQLFDELNILFQENSRTKKGSRFDFIAKENTWTHQRQKRRQKQFQTAKDDEETSPTKNRSLLKNGTDYKSVKRGLDSTDDEKVEPVSKKVKTSNGDEADCSKNQISALEGKLILKKRNGFVIVELYYTHGMLGRNGLYQLLQFFKNKFK